jgi:riboflavin synthase
MFTGIVEEIGVLKGVQTGAEEYTLQISCQKVLEDTKVGDSIAVNGVCLTVTGFSSSGFFADVMPQTFRNTNLLQLKVGEPLNLERALRLQDRLGGHLVSGHVDGVGIIKQKSIEKNATWVEICPPQALLKYMIEKGSIAIDGTSLTIAVCGPDSFQVSLIPHTKDVTILGQKEVGKMVNLECDIIGKYVERLLCKDSLAIHPKSNVTMDLLKEHGFLD